MIHIPFPPTHHISREPIPLIDLCPTRVCSRSCCMNADARSTLSTASALKWGYSGWLRVYGGSTCDMGLACSYICRLTPIFPLTVASRHSLTSATCLLITPVPQIAEHNAETWNPVEPYFIYSHAVYLPSTSIPSTHPVSALNLDSSQANIACRPDAEVKDDLLLVGLMGAWSPVVPYWAAWLPVISLWHPATVRLIWLRHASKAFLP